MTRAFVSERTWAYQTKPAFSDTSRIPFDRDSIANRYDKRDSLQTAADSRKVSILGNFTSYTLTVPLI